MNQNLEQLKKLAQIFNTDKLISPEEIQQIFKGIVEILATYKKDTSSINEDTKSVVNKLLEDVISIHKESVDAVEEKKKELGNDFADKLTELRQMVTSIQEEMDKEDEVPEDDTDDEEEKQALIAEIMAQITLPEVKATIVSGEEIVDKINELPLDEDNKIDWARIKNAPKIGKQTISGSPTVLANAVDLDGSTRANGYAITWDATRGRYTHTAMSGGGSPGGSTTQLQYNNAGAFGGISGATTDGTAVTFATDGLLANTLKSATSAGTLFESNSGTDVLLLGAGGGAGATFYGGVNLNTMTTGSVLFAGASGAISQDNSNFFWDNTNKRLGIGTSAPGSRLTVKSSAVGTYVVNFLGNSGNSLFKFYDNGNTDDSIYQQSFQGTVKVQFSANGDSYFTGGKIGLGTNAPTHSLTFDSTSTGIALYNTADQATNYERVLARWASNQFIIEQRNGGTGVGRSLLLQASDNADGNPAFINIFSASNVKIDMGLTGSFGGETNLVRIGSGTSLTASTAITQRFLEITGTINQATSAGYTALLVNPTETTTGSGSKLLADFQVGGSSKASINNTGAATLTGTATTLSGGGSLLTGLRISGVGTRYIGVQVQGQTISDLYFGRALSQDDFIVSRANQQTNELFRITNAGLVGIGLTPTAVLHLKAGTATASTAPLKFTAGTGLTAPEAGTMEFSNSETGLTFTAVSTRRAVVLDTATQTLTNKFITPQVQSVADAGGTLTPVSITNDIVIATALSQATTIAAPTGSPVQGEKLTIRLKDNGTARALTWNAIYRAIGVTLPTTTVISKIVYVGCIYNSTDTKWDVVSVAQEA